LPRTCSKEERISAPYRYCSAMRISRPHRYIRMLIENGSRRSTRNTTREDERPYICMKVITTHYNADFDALSSMIAAKKLYPDARLVFPGSQEKSVRDFLIRSTAYFLDITKLKEIDYNTVDTLILVDTKQRKRIGELARLLDNKNVTVHVYDHHPPTDDDIKGEVDVTGSTGACVSMLIGLLREKYL
jgi:tRNA nucleotidyltransferase (CCA-adding enzyme)